jgi:hypothetical protein
MRNADETMMRALPKTSRSHFVQIVGAFVVVLVPIIVACGSEDDTRYGGPAGLAGKRVAPITTATSAVAQGSSTSCDAGACAVSFTQTIYGKYMVASGTWKCADSSCHGAGSTQEPSIDGTSAQNAYNSLTTYTDLQGEPYIAACATNPSDSAMDCNLKGSCSQMPQEGAGVGAAAPTAAELADLDTWLACGAPFN